MTIGVVAVFLASAAAFAADDAATLKQLTAKEWTVPDVGIQMKRIPAAPDLPAESSGNSEPAAAATVTATVPTNAETPELVTTDASGNPVKLEPTPAVFSPEEDVSTMPETPAAATQAKPKQPGRVRKTKQQFG
jgi:hypothetical protein